MGKHEGYQGLKLTQERQELQTYQQRLDQARDRVDKGGLSADALNKLDDSLQKTMPEAVRARLSGAAVERGGPDGNLGAGIVPKPVPRPDVSMPVP